MGENLMIQLIDTLKKTVTLTDTDINLCSQYFEPISQLRNSILEMPNKIPLHLYFISKGFVRLFYHDDAGNEATTNLSSPGNFITSFLSFVKGIASKETLQCVTDCELLRISRTNLPVLINKSENFKNFSLIIFEQAIDQTTVRANDLATLNAEQRYKKLIAEHPQILQNVPIHYIASFLGIKAESLSRIRRQIIS